ncbi:flagellar hook-length control protein FliK [Clostridiaceae bacterium M8S5]|nr:flagellar hook-length control protein FliK [Clostridiaceae bacterium M8S5]
MKVSNNQNAFMMLASRSKKTNQPQQKKNSFEEILSSNKNTASNNQVKDKKVQQPVENNTVVNEEPKDKEIPKRDIKVKESTADENLSEQEGNEEQLIEIEEITQEEINMIMDMLAEAGVDISNLDEGLFEEISKEVDLKQLVVDINNISDNTNIPKQDILNKLTELISQKDGDVTLDKNEIKDLLSKFKKEVEVIKVDALKTGNMNKQGEIKIVDLTSQRPVEEITSIIKNKNEVSTKKSDESKENTMMPVKIINIKEKANINSNQMFMNLSKGTQETNQEIKVENITTKNIEYQNILEQVTKGTVKVINENQSMINIKLKPETLGNMTLKVVVEEGKVVAEAVVENQAVKNILLSNIQELKDNLSQQGLDVQKLDVSVGKEGMSQQGRQNFENQGKHKTAKKTVRRIEDNIASEDNYMSIEGISDSSSSIDVIA